MSTGQRRARHWLGGAFTEIGPERPSIDPADGRAIGSYCDGGAEAAARAIEAASAAFAPDGVARAAALSHLKDVFAAWLDELIDMSCLENGKLKAESTYEVAHIVRLLRFAAAFATQSLGRVLASSRPSGPDRPRALRQSFPWVRRSASKGRNLESGQTAFHPHLPFAIPPVRAGRRCP